MTPEEREALEFRRQHKEDDTDVSGTETRESATSKEELRALVKRLEKESIEKSNIVCRTDAKKTAVREQAASKWPRLVTIWLVLLCAVFLVSIWLYRGRYRYEKQGSVLTRVNLFTGSVDWLQPVPNPAFQPPPKPMLAEAVKAETWRDYVQRKGDPEYDGFYSTSCEGIVRVKDGYYDMSGSAAFDQCSRDAVAFAWNKQRNNGVPETVMKWVRVAQ